MSESPSKVTSADGQPELDEITDALYALRPDEFAAARDERVRQAKAEGRQPLARELSKLRRPTLSAWLLNLLWRDQPQVMDQFIELGGELSRAQADASGPELHRLTAQRRQLEGALIRQARALANQAGVSVSDAAEREAQETLSAVLARPEVAAEVRRGRLVKPATYAGFGTPGPAAALTRPAAPDADQAGQKRPTPLRPPHTDEVAERAAQRARERREQAQRAVDEARAALEAAASTLADQARVAEAAQQKEQAGRQQLEQLQEQVHEVQADIATAARAAQDAARRRDQADKAHQAAQRVLERAEQQLQDVR